MIRFARALPLIGTVLLAPVLACGDDDDDASPEWQSFTSEVHAYSIEYPPAWAVTEGGDDDTFAPPNPPETSVLVEFGTGPDQAADDPALATDAIEAISGHYGGDAEVVEVRDVGAHQALVLEWDNGGDEGNQYGLQVWVPNGDASWFVTMLSLSDHKDEYSDIFQRMLDSFEPE